MRKPGRLRTTPGGADIRGSGTGDGNAGHEPERGKGAAGSRTGFVMAQQVYEYLEQRRVCPNCHGLYTSKDSGSTVVSTVFGRVEVANPRWNRCPCQTDGPNTFRPMRTWLNGQ